MPADGRFDWDRPAPPDLPDDALGHYAAEPAGGWQLANAGRLCSHRNCARIAVAKLTRTATRWTWPGGRWRDQPLRIDTYDRCGPLACWGRPPAAPQAIQRTPASLTNNNTNLQASSCRRG